MGFDEILDSLENLVLNSKRVPLTNKRVIEEDDIADIIDLLKQALPIEIKKAKQIIEERDRIMDKARTEGDDHIYRAKEYSRTLIEKEEIFDQAKREASDLKRVAFEESDRLRTQAQHDANELLNSAREEADGIKNEAREYAIGIFDYVQETVEALQNRNQHIVDALTERKDKIRY